MDQEAISKDNATNEMTFLDHLEELRWHLLRSIVVIIIFTIIAFLNKSFVFDGIILAPTELDFWTYVQLCSISNKLLLGDAFCIKSIGFELINIHMAGQFVQHIIVSLAAGIVISFPYVFWEIWRFIKPALTRTEKTYARGMVFYCSFLFLAGVLFGYYFLTPMAVQFLGNYRISELIANQITLSSYISVVTMVTFAAALIFELPVVVYFLSKIGLVTPVLMRSYRKHAFLIFLILAAIITPPDVTSQILLMVPFLGLYEISIWISAYVSKKQKINT